MRRIFMNRTQGESAFIIELVIEDIENCYIKDWR